MTDRIRVNGLCKAQRREFCTIHSLRSSEMGCLLPLLATSGWNSCWNKSRNSNRTSNASHCHTPLCMEDLLVSATTWQCRHKSHLVSIVWSFRGPVDWETKSRTYSISLGVKSYIQGGVQHCQIGITLGQKLNENTGLLGNNGPDANSDTTSPCKLEIVSNLNNF